MMTDNEISRLRQLDQRRTSHGKYRHEVNKAYKHVRDYEKALLAERKLNDELRQILGIIPQKQVCRYAD